MTFRDANFEDVPALVAMGMRFLAASPLNEFMPPNQDKMTALVNGLIEEDGGYLAVAEDGDLQGMIGAVLISNLVSGELWAVELFWWVEPEARGRTGLRLLKGVEDWARGLGVRHIQLTAPTKRAGALYTRLGFAPTELSYHKAL